ncbi:MAG: NnrS family protein [Burkholderiales bacterium]|nr:NnrS family protein [Burkholderiales bacterium]
MAPKASASAPIQSGEPSWQAERLLWAPHRLGFFAAACVMAVAALWWTMELVWRVLPVAPLHHASVATFSHALVMSLGFLPLFFVGFLFTAGPKWLQMPDVPAPGLLKPVVACVVGWLTLLVGTHVSQLLAAAGVALAALGWSTLTWRFVGIVLRSPAADRLHAKLIALSCSVGALLMWVAAASLALDQLDWVRACAYLGLWWFVVPVYTAVAHRMIPFFTAAAVPVLDSWRPYWLLWSLMTLTWWHGAWVVMDAAGWAQAGLWLALRGVVSALACLGVLALAVRWGLVQSLKIRLLAMLHLGFVWLGVAYGLDAASVWLQGLGQMGLGLAPLHALSMGFLGSILLAMATRVSCGHSGRTLTADNIAWALYGVLQLAVVARMGAAVLPQYAGGILVVAALLWLIATGGWALRYGRWYGVPRVDGKKG